MLRALRNERGWTVDQVAKRLLCSPSKVSRLETGQRGAGARDIRDLCDLYEVDDDKRQRLMTLARQGKERAWWLQHDLPYSTYVGLEAEAASISDFGVGVVPGLLQTADYARAVVGAAQPGWESRVVDQRVNGRLARQQVLTAARPPGFEAMLDESVLHRVVGSPVIMGNQLERLLEVGDLPHVNLRVIPYDAGALPAVNKFIILGFTEPAIPDVVFIEGLTGDLYLQDADDVRVYEATFCALREMATSPERSRGLIASMVSAYRSHAG